MYRWKILFFGLLMLQTPCVLYLAYLNLDQGVTMAYQDASYQSRLLELRTLAELFPREQKSKDLLFRLRQKFPDALIVKEENSIVVNGLKFKFDRSDSLSHIANQSNEI